MALEAGPWEGYPIEACSTLRLGHRHPVSVRVEDPFKSILPGRKTDRECCVNPGGGKARVRWSLCPSSPRERRASFEHRSPWSTACHEASPDGAGKFEPGAGTSGCDVIEP